MRRRFLTAALGLAVLALAACGADKTPQQLSGMAISPPLAVGTLSLPDASNGGQPFAFKAPATHLLLVYFGYTNCPDVCPTTLSDVKKALNHIGTGKSSRVDLAMVTIDPNRDSATGLTAYVQNFVHGSHALRTTDDAALRTVATHFGADYSVKKADDGTIEVSHTANLYVIDSAGHVVLEWPFGMTPDQLATDLTIMFDHGVAA